MSEICLGRNGIKSTKLIALYFMVACMGCVSGCTRQATKEVQGYIEGRYTYMATSVSGTLKEIFVTRGTQVKKGQILFALKEQPESDVYNAAIENLKQAIASRNAIEANLAYAKLTYERNKALVPHHAVSQSQLDSAKATYAATVARLSEANAKIASTTATLAQTKWTKEQKVVFAPLNAVVFDTYYRLGEYTVANQAIVSLLAPGDIKVIFYVYEPELSHLKLGQKINVRCDKCAKVYASHISFISPSAEYTPPVIFSNETNQKLIYRIEAEFAPEEIYPLHPGQPVKVNYE